MTLVSRGETINVSNPKLVFYATRDGKLEDLSALTFEIFTKHDDAAKLSPSSVEGPTPVNLVADRIGLGRYAATWAVPASEQVGRHEIRWTYTFTGGTPQTGRVEFDVVEGGSEIGPSYALVSDMREEGVSKSVSTPRIAMALTLASRFFEQWTGRFFEPRFNTQRHSGRVARKLLLGHPIIGVERLALDTEPAFQGDLEVDSSLYRVFNRHLSQGMTNPDDRQSPIIEFVHAEDLVGIGFPRFEPLQGLSLRSLAFPQGVQNVEVQGVFGFTENVHNNVPWGDTPALVRHAVKRVALREIEKLTEIDCREDFEKRGRIIEEKTRDQSYKLDRPRKFGAQYTGDAEIDSIVLMFTRPPNLGAA